jgi:hypothetical protein
VPDLNSYTFGIESWNDQVTSISISGTYQVTLYENSFFRGRSVRIDSSTANISQVLDDQRRYQNWNDRASSLKIEPRRGRSDPDHSNSKQVGTLFSDSSLRGQSLTLYEGQHVRSMSDLDWNDKASSINLNPGYKIEMYADEDFRGASILISGKQTNLNNARNEQGRSEQWNDRMSSFKISKVGQ